jgi:predicted dehydrogenase
VTGVALVHRYLPFYRLIRELIRAGAFGRVRQIRIRTGRDIYTDPRFLDPAATRGGWLTNREIAGGGILTSSTIHLLSVSSFLLDDAPFTAAEAAVRQLHPRAYPGIEDDVAVRLRTDDDREVLIEDSWAREWSFELEVLGDEGRLQAHGPSWAGNVTLSGRLTGPVPPAYPEFAAAGGFRVNAGAYAGLCPTLFEGLLADFAAGVRAGSTVQELPTIRHARNMHAAIALAAHHGLA